MEGMRATRQTENMGPAGNTARQIFHSGVRDIEAGLANTDAIAPGRDRKRMMRRNKYTKENLRARARATRKLTGSRATEQMGSERKKVKFWEID